MVRVANCPKCNHEAVMFDETDSDDWARCPECRTYFQIKSATAREIPQFVTTKDEAVLAKEESEASVETVCSALETRWDDSRRTLPASASKTIAEMEAVMGDAERNGGGDDDLDDAAGKQPGRQPANRTPEKLEPPKPLTGTVSDFSMLGTWSDLPGDEVEAQARAVEAGDAPMASSDLSPDEHQLADQAAGTAKELDREFQFKETLSHFDPIALDDADRPAHTHEDVLVDADDELMADESGTDWDDPEEMMRLLSRSDDAAGDAEDVDDIADGPVDRDRSADSQAAAESQTSPRIAPRRTQPHWAQNRRQRSALRSIAMIAIAGLFGLALGYYALFWIAGPNGDFLNIAQFVPAEILPAEFRGPASPAVNNESPVREQRAAATVQASHAEPVDDEAALDTVAEPQQSDVTPANSLNTTGESMLKDIAASEPLEFDPSAAAPLAETVAAVEPVIVQVAPSFTADELAAALQMARDAQAGLVEGDLDGDIEVKRAKGKSYALLCDLAQKATFVDREPQPDAVAALETETQKLFQATLAAPQTRDEVARIVPMWLESANRKHGGIFFAAAIQNQAEKGSVIECEVDLGGQMLVVMVPKSAVQTLPQAAQPAAIVGWFLERPADSLNGYTGNATSAIWAGHIIPLE